MVRLRTALSDRLGLQAQAQMSGVTTPALAAAVSKTGWGALGCAARDSPRLPFPAQNRLTGPHQKASAEAGSPDFMALWAGQAAPLARRLAAGDLVKTLAGEALEAIDRVAKLRA